MMDMGGGEMDMGGPEEMGLEDVPPGPEDAMGGAEGGDESSLLAVPPGSRDVPTAASRTPGNRKLYYPKRDPAKGHRDVARQYSMKASGGGSIASTGIRNTTPGGADIMSLSKMGIYTEEQSNYSLKEQTEEDKLFQIHDSLRVLIEDLEGNEKNLKEHVDED